MEQTIEELANYIINEIYKEDFFCAMRDYGGFKMKTTAKQISEWWDEI